MKSTACQLCVGLVVHGEERGKEGEWMGVKNGKGFEGVFAGVK